MNRVVLMGRLVRDPETRYSQDGKGVSKFTLAVDRRMKKDEADFISCVAFGKTAEFVEKYLKKGTKIACEGRWQTGSYTNKEGVKVYTNDCIIDQMEFAESKKVENNKDDDFMNIPDDNPFVSDELPL